MTRITFRPLRSEDLPLLVEWLTRPHVVEWFGPPDSIDDLRRECLDDQPESRVRAYVAFADDRPIGFIQSYVAFNAGGGWWPDERDPGARGIDQFLAEESLLGRGLGTAMIRAFVEQLFSDPAVTKVQTDPSPANARAIRACEKAGFERLGIVTTPDGPAMLMVCTRARFEAGSAE